MKRSIAILALLAVAGAWPLTSAFAHAFPDRQHPGAGDVLNKAPHQVRIVFDADLEPAFSHLKVENAKGEVVSKKSRVAAGNQKLLEVELPALSPGKYHVYWHVVARDGHTTQGDYSFTVAR